MTSGAQTEDNVAHFRTFLVHNPKLPSGPPSEDEPVTTPLTLTIGKRGAEGPWQLITPASNPFDEDAGRECYTVTAGSVTEEPEPSPEGHPRTYVALNPDVVDQLETAGVLRRTGSTSSLTFIKFPLCDILVPPSEQPRFCPSCEEWEVEGEPRFLRCSACKQEFYSSAECQREEWPNHKKLCKKLAQGAQGKTSL